MDSYDYGRGSVRKRAMWIARQRGWFAQGGPGGSGMLLPIVVLLVAGVVALWTLVLVGSLIGALIQLIPTAIVGLLTGWLAAKLVGARLSVGWTILAGIAGSWLGNALFAVLLPRALAGGLLMHFVGSVLGAAVLIMFARAVARPSLTGPSYPRLGRTF